MLEGWVKLVRLSTAGTETVVDVFTRGRSFGEAVAIRGDVYPVSAEAVTAVRTVCVPARELRAQLQAKPEVALAILSSTFVHLHSLVGQLEQLKARSGGQRVAQFLLSLAPQGAVHEAEFVLPYDKTLIAARLGMTPESLSRAFAMLRRHGVDIRRSRARVTDIPALARFADEFPPDEAS